MHPQTHMGTVGLVVTDLDRSLDYYQNNIGLRLHDRSDGVAFVGAEGRALLELREQADARPVQRGRTGLYHYALLVSSRVELARTLRHLIDTRTPLSGMSDHAVSEALYLGDPDGHGIEIYHDRPREQWPRVGSEISMTVDPLDVDGLLGELSAGKLRWEAIDPATTMGHVHLHVASTQAAEHFYLDVLGFDLTIRYGAQASFISAGGYHHHLGANTWAGVGAPPPPDDAARLLYYEILVPDAAALQDVRARLENAGIALSESDGQILTRDPAQNVIHFAIDTGHGA